jgi:Ca2+:H+ antiporter
MIFTYLLLLVPLSLALAYLHVPSIWIFISATAAIVPLAEGIRRATEQMAERAGPAVGGLLNVTFGNTAELILALFLLHSGKTSVVQAMITGSVIGNSLVGLGLAILVGSWGREKQVFERERAGLLASLLILSVIALLIPALFDYTERGLLAVSNPGALDERLSLGVSVVLILVYGANLFYTLLTHRDVFAIREGRGPAKWSLLKSLVILLGATAMVAAEAQLVSGAIVNAGSRLGLSTFFLGVIVLPLVGNAAEYFAAIYFARQDRMGLVMSIAVGSSIQVALLTAPLLVLISYALKRPMNLVFSNPLELIAIAGAAFAVNSIAQDGETTWFEGLLLIAVYALLALAFFFVSPS